MNVFTETNKAPSDFISVLCLVNEVRFFLSFDSGAPKDDVFPPAFQAKLLDIELIRKKSSPSETLVAKHQQPRKYLTPYSVSVSR